MTDRSAIVTRFAPSPTGELHIGGARTALFNWALARRHGGKFILRLEDTDRARSSEASTRRIIADLKWLGIDWDEGPDIEGDSLEDWLKPDAPIVKRGDQESYFQSERLDIYRRYIDQLLESGRAYKCFKTPEELDAMRQAARAAGKAIAYDPAESRSLTSAQIAALEAQGRPYVVRFAMPDHAITVRDAVLGDVTVEPSQLEDFVIVKADGFPTFHFAVVVDDSTMGVTHVMRGQEHLANTPKHIALQEALGFDHPVYAHIPLIFNPDGSKMSKRDKAKAARAAGREHVRSLAEVDGWIEDVVRDGRSDANYMARPESAFSEADVRAFLDGKNDHTHIAGMIAFKLGVPLPEIDTADFRDSGYLPHALNNYLALLGWNPGGDVERFDMEFLRQNFSIERIGKSNAKFDREKLLAFNQEAIAKLPESEFRHQLWNVNTWAGRSWYARYFDGPDDPLFIAFARAYQPRSRTLRDPEHLGAFFFKKTEDITYDLSDKNIHKTLLKNDGEGKGVLDAIRPILKAVDPWSGAAAQAALEKFAETRNLKLGAIAQPLRIAISGTTVTPPLDLTLEILGGPAVLHRIQWCLIQSSPPTHSLNP